MRTTIAILMLAILANVSVQESPSLAATRVTDDFSVLLKQADCVVDAKVLSLKGEPTSALGMPRSLVTIKIVKSYKGTLKAGDETVCEIFGGNDGTHTVVMPGQAHLAEGDSALLLLTKAGSLWRIAGGDIGHVEYYQNEKNVTMAKREDGVFDYYIQDKKSITGYSAVKSAAVSAEHLGLLIQAVLETGKPVIENQAVAATALPNLPSNRTAAATPVPAASTHTFPIAATVLILAMTSLAWVLVRRRA